jgi:lipopolysaccharide export system protein LptA
VSKAARLLAAALVVASSAPAQQPAGEALKRPIAEAGLLQPSLAPVVNEAAVPRAVPVNPRDNVPAPPPAPDPAPPAPEPEKKVPGQTIITSEKATFDNRKHIAVFTIKVTVDDPEFDLTCDELTAHLRHPAGESGETDAPPAKPAGKGRLQRAIARGHVFIVQVKTGADGSEERSMAWAEKADYDVTTGDIVLSGMPVVQQGINRCTATSPETTITLNRDSNMKVDGHHRTTITDKADLEPQKTEHPKRRSP